MKPKEKAKYLVDNMYYATDEQGYYSTNKYRAKQCALIAVDEMILVLPFTDINTSLNEYAIHLQKYLEQVKHEIEQL